MAAVWAKRKVNSAAAKRKSHSNHSVRDIGKSNRKPLKDASVNAGIRATDKSRTNTQRVTGSDPDDQIPDERSSSFLEPTESSNVRVSMRIDFQPDICKQFIQTGRCKYGDACKFSHERGDAKVSSARSRPWKLGSQPPEPITAVKTDNCSICSNTLSTPVKPKCGHRCCEKCFLSQLAVSQSPPTCNTCREPLGASAEFD